MIADPIRRQLDEIEIVRGRPMIITDADEVLFAFMAGLEGYLNGEGLTFDFSSFAITGNVKDANGVALDQQAEIMRLRAEKRPEAPLMAATCQGEGGIC